MPATMPRTFRSWVGGLLKPERTGYDLIADAYAKAAQDIGPCGYIADALTTLHTRFIQVEMRDESTYVRRHAAVHRILVAELLELSNRWEVARGLPETDRIVAELRRRLLATFAGGEVQDLRTGLTPRLYDAILALADLLLWLRCQTT